jgi:hypothetical protein
MLVCEWNVKTERNGWCHKSKLCTEE